MKSTQINAYLSIFGEVFLPSDLDKLLGIKSTASSKKDEIIDIHRDTRYKETSWDYEVGFKETLFVGDALNELFTVLSEKEELISQYARQNNLTCKIFVVVEIFEKQIPGIFIDKKIIRFAKNIDAEIDIDIYLIDE